MPAAVRVISRLIDFDDWSGALNTRGVLREDGAGKVGASTTVTVDTSAADCLHVNAGSGSELIIGEVGGSGRADISQPDQTSGLRIMAGNAASAAKLQLFGTAATGLEGQIFIDGGAHASGDIIFRAGTSTAEAGRIKAADGLLSWAGAIGSATTLWASGNVAPPTSAGPSVRLAYNSGTGTGYVQAFNWATSAYVALQIDGLSVAVTASGTTRLAVDGTGIGFFNTAPVAKPTVTGSRGGNAALASLSTALANLGLITNSTTA